MIKLTEGRGAIFAQLQRTRTRTHTQTHAHNRFSYFRCAKHGDVLEINGLGAFV